MQTLELSSSNIFGSYSCGGANMIFKNSKV